MLKKQSTKTLSCAQRLQTAAVIGLAGVFLLGSVGLPHLIVQADSYDEQIRALRQQNTKNKQKVSGLAGQAASYQDAILQYERQINNLQAAIEQNQAKQADLQKQIDAHQVELERQRGVLGTNIKAMYLDGELTTIEMLATSKDLSEYVDKETYRNVVQRQVQDTLTTIAKLQNQLAGKKHEVETLIADQKEQRSQVASSRSEQAKLLAMNQQQQSGFQQKIKANQARIASLRAAQEAANAQLFGGGSSGGGVAGGGAYQWGDARCLHVGAADPPCGNYDWGYPNAASPRDLYDPWGYGYRNCTSWVAFRLNQTGYRSFAYLGNAKQWPGRVPSSWVSYGSGARVGDAAVSTGGNYGHVMYVEAVNGNTVTISDYNRSGDGKYRSGSTRSQAGLYFISFPR